MESFFKNLSRKPQGPPSDDGSAAGWDDEIPQPDSSVTPAPTSDKSESTRSSTTCAAQDEEDSQPLSENKYPEKGTLLLDDSESSKRAIPIQSNNITVSTESQQTQKNRPAANETDPVETKLRECLMAYTNIQAMPEMKDEAARLLDQAYLLFRNKNQPEPPATVRIERCDEVNNAPPDSKEAPKKSAPAPAPPVKLTLAETIKNPDKYFVEIFEPEGDWALRAGPDKQAFRVCSRSLARASSVFNKLKLKVGADLGRWKFNVPQADPSALRIILQIAHGRLELVPPNLTFDMLMEVAYLADKHDMISTLKPFWRKWYSKAPAEHDDATTRIRNLWLSEKLGLIRAYKDAFSKFVMFTCLDRDGRLYFDRWGAYDLTKDKFMTPAMLDKIKLNRQEILSMICQHVRDNLDFLLQDASSDPICPARCSFGMRRLCDASMLGALYKAMLMHGLLDWFKDRMSGVASDVTMSVAQFTNKLEEIRNDTIETSGIRTDIH